MKFESPDSLTSKILVIIMSKHRTAQLTSLFESPDGLISKM